MHFERLKCSNREANGDNNCVTRHFPSVIAYIEQGYTVTFFSFIFFCLGEKVIVNLIT